jgi:hypothetical protein
MGTVAKRFWAKVHKTINFCWLWEASCNRKGYGYFRFRGMSWLAHRVAWVLCFGEIPDGLDVLHTCDTPPCVRPSHLFLGNDADNVADKVAKDRHTRGELNSHKLTTEEVLLIRSLHGRFTMAVLARIFGVAASQIFNIVHRRNWRHV